MIQRGLGLLWADDDDLTSKRPLSKYGYGIGGFATESIPDTQIQSDRDDVRDQESTQSCTGHGITDAARTACILRGYDPGPLSPLFSYAAARAKGKDAKYFVPGDGYHFVGDAGAYPSAVMAGAEGWGFVQEAAFPFDPSKVNEVPDFGTIVTGRETRIGLGQWELVSGITNMRRAMHADCTMVIAFTVTESFLDLDGGWCESMTGEVKGGHMMALRGRVAVTVRGVKRYGWLVANSWGRIWGDGGFVVMSDELFTSPFCKAVLALKAAPIRKSP